MHLLTDLESELNRKTVRVKVEEVCAMTESQFIFSHPAQANLVNKYFIIPPFYAYFDRKLRIQKVLVNTQ